MASSAYLSWMATELTVVLTLFVMLFKIRSLSSHIPDTPLTSYNLSMSVYFHPCEKPMAQQFILTHTKHEPVCTTKKLFFCFYSQAKRIAYTRVNIGTTWRAAGIQPYNPDAVIQPLLKKLEQSRSPRKSSDGRHV